jgi:hypothetical protein
MEEGVHPGADCLVVTVKRGPVGGLAAAAGAPDADEDRRDDLVAAGGRAGDGAGLLGRHVVAA